LRTEIKIISPEELKPKLFHEVKYHWTAANIFVHTKAEIFP